MTGTVHVVVSDGEAHREHADVGNHCRAGEVAVKQLLRHRGHKQLDRRLVAVKFVDLDNGVKHSMPQHKEATFSCAEVLVEEAKTVEGGGLFMVVLLQPRNEHRSVEAPFLGARLFDGLFFPCKRSNHHLGIGLLSFKDMVHQLSAALASGLHFQNFAFVFSSQPIHIHIARFQRLTVQGVVVCLATTRPYPGAGDLSPDIVLKGTKSRRCEEVLSEDTVESREKYPTDLLSWAPIVHCEADEGEDLYFLKQARPIENSPLSIPCRYSSPCYSCWTARWQLWCHMTAADQLLVG